MWEFEQDVECTYEQLSNNENHDLPDEEIKTIHLFVIEEQQRFTVKQIHRFANEYLRSWFPKLGPYSTFFNRLNRLSTAFKKLVTNLITEYYQDDCSYNHRVLASILIIACSKKRFGNDANNITDRGYCSTKSMF